MPEYPTGQEFAAVHTLVSPSGFRAVFNSPADSDYIGALLGDDAITGLDSPTIRPVTVAKTQADGAYQGYNFHGERPITMRPTISRSSVAARNVASSKLRKVLNDCMIADGTLTWTPTGGISHFVRVRKNAEYREAGGVIKVGFFGLMAADPFIYSTTLRTTGSLAPGTNTTVENQGNATVFPTAVTITGPGTGPQVRWLNYPSYVPMYFPALTLTSGQAMTIDFANKTILRNDGVNLYQYLALPPNGNWVPLAPGNNTFRPDMDSGSNGSTTFTLTWRDGWL